MKATIAATALVLILANFAFAYPVTYELNGFIRYNYEGGAPPGTEGPFPPFSEGAEVTGIFNWDTTFSPDESSAPWGNTILTNGLTVLELTIADVPVDISYSYYESRIIDEDQSDEIWLWNLGTQTFEYNNRLYYMDVVDIIFEGPADMFNEGIYPDGFDFSSVDSGRMITTIQWFRELDEPSGGYYNYHNHFEIEFDHIQAVPEPKAITLFMLLSGIAFFTFRRFRRSS